MIESASRYARYLPFVSLGLCGLLSDCGSQVEVVAGPTSTAATGSGPNGSTTGSAAGGADGGSSGGGSSGSESGAGGHGGQTPECQLAFVFGGKLFECGDCVDNDGDGKIDSADEHCTGPADNGEHDFFYWGSSPAGCDVDCEFDLHTGVYWDDCHWSHRCDLLEVSPKWYPEPNWGETCSYESNYSPASTDKTCPELAAAQSSTCLDRCLPLAPNGCDCFGCCELPARSGTFVWLSSSGLNGNTTCAMEGLSDPDICHPCTPVPSCMNTCEGCELCLGETALPQGCAAAPDCAPGQASCGLPGLEPCQNDEYCITGCCVALPQ